jgi:hypothetical protein
MVKFLPVLVAPLLLAGCDVPAAPSAEAPASAAEPAAAAEPAPAEEPLPASNISATAPSGKRAKFDAYYTVNPDCSSKGYADILIKNDVQHGKFYVKRGRDYPKFPHDSSFHKCNATLVPSTQLYYKSIGGYVGDDTLAVEVTLANGLKLNVTYNITIK